MKAALLVCDRCGERDAERLADLKVAGIVTQLEPGSAGVDVVT